MRFLKNLFQKHREPAPPRGHDQQNRMLPTEPRPEVVNEINFVRDHNLASLSLNNQNLTKIPEEVFSLTRLVFIDLSQNNLETIPERLWDLPLLQRIILIGNPIKYLPNRPNFALDLPTYRRCQNQVAPEYIHLFIDTEAQKEDADFAIAELGTSGGPQRLTVGKWRITIGDDHPRPNPETQRILNTLAKFTLLEHLSLRGIRLEAVPEGIRQLRQLKHLALDSLRLNDLPDWIGDLDLATFSAVGNKLPTVPDSFRNFKSLSSLTLDQNPIQQIPQCLFSLASLEHLSMIDCEIADIPPDILQLHRLKYFYYPEKIESPPTEVADKGLDAIRDYWRQRADTGVDYLCEAKLIILGEAGAGKTSLARKIENPSYQLREHEKSTEGIDVIRHRFPTTIRTREDGAEKALNRTFQVNIWDFGGQEIYHATHQFFLTKRSVYVLVCDDRKEDTDFSYWLQVVEMLSDASPLLIVQNEKQGRTRDINLSSLRARFANLRAGLSTNLDTNQGLDRVIQVVQKELESLSHIGIGLPATWKRVREALERDQRDYISLEEYLGVCQQHGFTRRRDKLQLSGYLHDLGICLHFQDDPLLKNTVVLKPSWGTDAVYRVLDDSEVISERGQFTRAQLGRIWSETKYEGM